MLPNADTYMRRLQDAGYRTSLFGKAHLYWQQFLDLKPWVGYMQSLGFEDVYETGRSWAVIGSVNVR